MFKKDKKEKKDIFEELKQEENSNSLNSSGESITNQEDNSAFDPNDPNAVFFEKFERSKKDIAKDKKKQRQHAKRSLGLKNRILGFENRLRDDLFIRKMWLIVGISTFFILAYSCVIMGFLGDKFYGTSDYKWTLTAQFSSLTQAIVVFSGFVIVLLPLPYLYLMASWFVGINSIHRSKPFVITTLVFYAIAIVLTILLIPMSSFLFDNVRTFAPLSSGS